jgi:hypothetical protein
MSPSVPAFTSRPLTHTYSFCSSHLFSPRKPQVKVFVPLQINQFYCNAILQSFAMSIVGKYRSLDDIKFSLCH